MTKIMAEDACLFYAAHMRVPVCIVRPFNLFGPGQSEHFLVPTLLRQALDPNFAEISVADSRPRRDFLYIADFVELLIATMRHRATGIYNAGSGTSVSVGELASAITSITGPKPLVSRGEQRPNEILDVRADIAKAARDLGWKPSTRLDEGLREILGAR
jgi:nucleoside-diphosphate-sugar epimerase